MSITKSFNHQTNITYAYETTYEWDEAKQKKVQKKRCIGQFDPETGEIIPNGRRGRPSRSTIIAGTKEPTAITEAAKPKESLLELNNRLGLIEGTLEKLTADIHALKAQTEKVLSER